MSEGAQARFAFPDDWNGRRYSSETVYRDICEVRRHPATNRYNARQRTLIPLPERGIRSASGYIQPRHCSHRSAVERPPARTQPTGSLRFPQHLLHGRIPSRSDRSLRLSEWAMSAPCVRDRGRCLLDVSALLVKVQHDGPGINNDLVAAKNLQKGRPQDFDVEN